MAEYWLKHQIECALNDCRTPHGHGLLVRTADETETCIGSDCGQKYFPDDYDALRRSFNVRRARAAHMDVISEYLERAAGYNSDIDTVWYEDRGGRWADECKDLYIKLCPASVRNHIMQMARSGSWVIKVQVRISEEEKDNDAGLGYRRDQEYIERRVGFLRGGAALPRGLCETGVCRSFSRRRPDPSPAKPRPGR